MMCARERRFVARTDALSRLKRHVRGEDLDDRHPCPSAHPRNEGAARFGAAAGKRDPWCSLRRSPLPAAARCAPSFTAAAASRLFEETALTVTVGTIASRMSRRRGWAEVGATAHGWAITTNVRARARTHLNARSRIAAPRVKRTSLVRASIGARARTVGHGAPRDADRRRGCGAPIRSPERTTSREARKK